MGEGGWGSYTERNGGGGEGDSQGQLLEMPGPLLGGERQSGLRVQKKGQKEKGVPGVWNSMNKGLEAAPRKRCIQDAVSGGWPMRPGRET